MEIYCLSYFGDGLYARSFFVGGAGKFTKTPFSWSFGDFIDGPNRLYTGWEANKHETYSTRRSTWQDSIYRNRAHGETG
jgi:hypothetical protein